MAKKLKKDDVLLYQFEIYSNYIELITLRIIIRKEKAIYQMDVDNDIIDNVTVMAQLKEAINSKERSVKGMLDLPLQIYDILIANKLRSGTVFIFKTHDEILKRKVKNFL